MTRNFGIKALGAYVPRLRLERSAIAQAHQWMAPSLRGLAKGERAFHSWDEDTITMAVEAGRVALGEARDTVSAIQLASTTLPYADMLNASVVAAALRLPESMSALDSGHSQRAGTSALRSVLDAGNAETLLIASDAPPAKPASTQEMSFGAGAAALLLGTGDLIAAYLGGASRTVSFADHYRAEGEAYDYVWEERWVRDEGYLKIVPATVKEALAVTGCDIADIARFVLASPIRGIAEAVAKKVRFAGIVEDQLTVNCGYAGAAHPLLMLVGAIDAAAIGDKIMLVGFGQGCDVMIFEKVAEPAQKGVLARTLADYVVTSDYLRMVAFRGGIDLDWGMRAERDTKTAMTEVYRSAHQMHAFVAGQCRSCQTVQFPQLPYCVNPACNAAADYDPVPLTDVRGKVLTITADLLSYCMAPPLWVGFIQFDNGARVMMEVVDPDSDGVEIGMPVKMAYRIKELDLTRGYNRYFWKAVPVKEQANG
jgi:3-hydroxy-3-methylglutaryl CoA synthase